jgi:hypothetical protein
MQKSAVCASPPSDNGDSFEFWTISRGRWRSDRHWVCPSPRKRSSRVASDKASQIIITHRDVSHRSFDFDYLSIEQRIEKSGRTGQSLIQIEQCLMSNFVHSPGISPQRKPRQHFHEALIGIRKQIFSSDDKLLRSRSRFKEIGDALVQGCQLT